MKELNKSATDSFYTFSETSFWPFNDTSMRKFLVNIRRYKVKYFRKNFHLKRLARFWIQWNLY